jgi:Protein of unknown function (DUF2946)
MQFVCFTGGRPRFLHAGISLFPICTIMHGVGSAGTDLDTPFWTCLVGDLEEVVELMHGRLRKFLPIVVVAMAVQILAPIAACWAASTAASDPLHVAVICHDAAATQGPGDNQGDQTGQPRAHDGCCSVCNVVHTGAPVHAPQTSAAAPYFQSTRVVWRDRAPDLFGSRAGSHAQARAPPRLT